METDKTSMGLYFSYKQQQQKNISMTRSQVLIPRGFWLNRNWNFKCLDG